MGSRIDMHSEQLFKAQPSPALLARRLKLGTYREEPDGLHRLCCRCNEYWPADTEFFYYAKKKGDGLHSWCKACYEEWRYPNGRPSYRQYQPSQE
ncbi:hypothetical protein IHQ56_02610 [Methylobacillus flagellatus]|uniref:hypothetical protein n=1 Tax=Methylobacillus flagellatus TaxID=405 RepID=UPI002853BF45|nr:hypothetical protein [Methylobacillus flagellatus]MDR5170701.1 hypothetical protein [Methylobacillus flagellatus]